MYSSANHKSNGGQIPYNKLTADYFAIGEAITPTLGFCSAPGIDASAFLPPLAGGFIRFDDN